MMLSMGNPMSKIIDIYRYKKEIKKCKKYIADLNHRITEAEKTINGVRVTIPPCKLEGWVDIGISGAVAVKVNKEVIISVNGDWVNIKFIDEVDFYDHPISIGVSIRDFIDVMKI